MPAGDAPKWELLDITGLPGNASSHLIGLGRFDSPSTVAQLSADGDNLIAIGNDGFVYYMKWGTRKWVNKWGKPLSKNFDFPRISGPG